MVTGALFAIVMLTIGDVGIPNLLLVLIVMHIAVTAFIFKQVPVFIMRFLVWMLSQPCTG